MNNEYPSNGWMLPINNWKNWKKFAAHGMYTPANDTPHETALADMAGEK